MKKIYLIFILVVLQGCASITIDQRSYGNKNDYWLTARAFSEVSENDLLNKIKIRADKLCGKDNYFLKKNKDYGDLELGSAEGYNLITEQKVYSKMISLTRQVICK